MNNSGCILPVFSSWFCFNNSYVITHAKTSTLHLLKNTDPTTWINFKARATKFFFNEHLNHVLWNHHVCSVWHNACIKHCEHVSTSPICFMYVWITQSDNYEFNCVLYSFFSVWLLSVLRGHSVFSSPPQRPMTSNFEGFSIPDFIHCILFSYLIFWERASIFPFECSVLNKDTSSTIFISSFVWRGPWLGIETGASSIA